MLSMTISYKKMIPFELPVTNEHIITNESTKIEIPFANHEVWTIIHHKRQKYWYIQFPPTLKLNQLELIHQITTSIIENCENCHINDSRAFIGYLSNGQSAYIYHHFNEWKSQTSRNNDNHCLARTKVTIFDKDNRLGSGILITYKEIQNEGIASATLLTPYGEKQFFQKN